ncbi:hypothetical protein B0H34DRAFT_793499 [Crassisporium funariophilum]|nr:hypothetical protein B0H34DRAFT_793499 [Crassisporium funariophilum]
MSRHREVRNLNIHDELNDDALSDGGEEDLTHEQQGLHEDTLLASVRAEIVQAQMSDGLEQVRLVIGNEDTSDLSDKSIKDALWEYYFDVEKTVTWALEETERRQVAKERKGTWHDHEQSSSDRSESQGAYQYQQSNQSGALPYDDDLEYHDPNGRSRLPAIFLAQQQPGFDGEAYFAVENSPRPKNKLSRISERTERTEPVLWRSRQQYLIPNTPRSFMSSPTTSYGQELDDSISLSEHTYQPPDPNTSRTSPSGSAIHRLSTYDRPPSNASSITHNDQSYPVTTSEPVSSLPDIPSLPDDDDPSVPLHVPAPTKSVSKLSKLASERASTISTRSESSRSSGTAVTGSIKTFPALRPSAHSERPPSSVASSKDLPDIPRSSVVTTPSATSSLVNRAIQTALELEAVDRKATPRLSRPQSPPASELSDRSKTPTPRNVKYSQAGSEPIKSTSSAQDRPLSKLALLAQRKAESSSRSPTFSDLPSPAQSSLQSRPLSKLALLAQQKVDGTRVPKLPKTATEYLTPIANGSSVTTAITTSYQSLYSLTDSTRSSIIPKLNVVPLQSSPGLPTSPQKPSKLAMKIKRAGEKAFSPGFPSEDEIIPPISPIFQPGWTHGRASPSAFASVLVHDHLVHQDNKGKSKEARHRRDERKRAKEEKSSSSNVLSSSVDSHPHRSRKHRHPDSPSLNPAMSTHFDFDGPSPDDIVLNARKGTILGQKASGSASTSRISAGAGKSVLSS